MINQSISQCNVGLFVSDLFMASDKFLKLDIFIRHLFYIRGWRFSWNLTWSNNFWSRVEEEYNNSKIQNWEVRSKRSVQSRIQTIEKATRKMHACIRQIENRHISGASNEDILDQARLLFAQDEKFKAGWKFEHVWNIIKNFEKFQDGNSNAGNASRMSNFGNASSESENLTPDSGKQQSPGLSAFSLNLDDDEYNIRGSQSERTIGVKKVKLKRKIDEEMSTFIKTLEDGNKQLIEQLKKTSAQRQQHLELQNKNYALKELKEENKILFQDLSSIQNPNVREFVQAEQARILEKRFGQQQHQQQPPSSSSFGQYLSDFGGADANLPDY
ncbi:hypothetical protein KFK09_018966 [Dendrobium nobile]|uniref:No apical meristem-associated C-terminal domain-containing protein n=1 Tax=Dendrobium nobile TaxID=94219 RepID=A0A8T3AXA0_DENNO|nr:hypothetical protein KFK09_018966 [Dendrobium nobile]